MSTGPCEACGHPTDDVRLCATCRRYRCPICGIRPILHNLNDCFRATVSPNTQEPTP